MTTDAVQEKFSGAQTVEQQSVEHKRAPVSNFFWMAMFGGILGVFMEGIFCILHLGRWETHVTSIIWFYNILYGLGGVLFYALGEFLPNARPWKQFVVSAVICDGLELLAGALLEFGLGMKAWDYSQQLFNIHGWISFPMTVAWGALGVFFVHKMKPWLDHFFERFQTQGWRRLCVIMAVVFVIDLAATAGAFVRWSNRHKGYEPANAISVWYDKECDDNFMETRFVEWYFIDEV